MEFWSPFILGVFSTLGTITLCVFYSWHLEALKIEKASEEIIDAEFYDLY
tara:strand:- start:78 stop:227 length:150 start_codon:yes stop_codon:yes gene_type:complete